MSEEREIVKLQISEKEPVEIDFGDNESARFHKVTIDVIDKEHPTKLIAEYDSYTPDSIETGEPKTERLKNELLVFDGSGNEFEINFRPDAADNAKFFVEGPGVITVHGQFGPKNAFLPAIEEEEEEEEEGEDADE